jgi:hypothetical protein
VRVISGNLCLFINHHHNATIALEAHALLLGAEGPIHKLSIANQIHRGLTIQQ